MTTNYTKYANTLKRHLLDLSTPAKAEASRRYFPHGIVCVGANAADIKFVVKHFLENHPQLTPEQLLAITETVLERAEYSEEKMVAYGLISKHVKKHYDDTLLQRFRYWLENYANNWALVDDLCMKTLFNFFMARPHLIEHTKEWAYSDVSWCRRASNVAWVKFIKRKIGKTEYKLDKKLIFENCSLLISDQDEFVQKSIGWLLKVTAAEHEKDVLAFIEKNAKNMPRGTIRYALEKVDVKR
ncbi:DNA alkylation repair protein [Saccharophagus degradans]|uniref:DNA alkylation repair protein n=1 Tax=Saccharophagus degradans TaxID=86304 RepID=A0AAW7X7R4_9GAMM|nr:DNA alkylation repair protein [Saccharophagus degradans]MDO6423900.1 DNA alkylation repair protein [Saccharophagus degradans]MDO6607977.1 DNA alkylation repair protein [Saccharophagus degradans]